MNNPELKNKLPKEEREKVSRWASIMGVVKGCFMGMRRHYLGRSCRSTYNDICVMTYNGARRGLEAGSDANNSFPSTVERRAASVKMQKKKPRYSETLQKIVIEGSAISHASIVSEDKPATTSYPNLFSAPLLGSSQASIDKNLENKLAQHSRK